LLESDSVDRQDCAVQCEGGRCRCGAEPIRQSRRASLTVDGGEQTEKAREHDRHARELSDVHRGPNPAAGIGGENGGVVIGLPAGVKQRDDHVQQLADEQQRA
jgi:hypothetical protein